MRVPGKALAIGACALVGTAGVMAASDVTGRADAQVRVTAAQLVINQKISQAAVRRGNEALRQIAALREQIAVLTGGVRVPTILWGVSSGGPQESLVANRGGVGVSSIFSGQNGRYVVKFDRNVAACTYQATIAADSEAGLTQARSIRVALNLADAARTQLVVFTSRPDGNAARTPFHIQVTC